MGSVGHEGLLGVQRFLDSSTPHREVFTHLPIRPCRHTISTNEIDSDIAAELITNHLAMLTSPTWAAQRSDSADALRGNGQTLHWHATDGSSLGTSGDWFIERQPGGVQWQRQNYPADVTVSGPATSLLLIVTRRLPPVSGQPQAITIGGNADLVRHWVQHAAHDAG